MNTSFLAAVMSSDSHFVRNPTRRSSAVWQFFGKHTQVLPNAVDNALKAALLLSAQSIQP